MKVLLVEDEPELRAALRLRLTASGYVCETANNGKEALNLLSRGLPDIVVTDLLMPEMDGYSLCQQLRSNKLWAEIPVLVLSAVPRHAIEHKQAIQASRVMHKPFDSSELLSAIKELLDEKVKQGG